MLMAKADTLASVLYVVLMSRAKDQASQATLLKMLDFFEMQLQQSKTDFFLNKSKYSMVDLYVFPFISRLFYMKDSALNDVYLQF